jgi:HSP20 family protein
MKAELQYSKECNVYPGQYIPSPEVKVFIDKLKISGKNVTAQPLLNFDEYKDHFKIEVLIPGTKREDIFIDVQDNILSIIVLNKDCAELKKKLQIHEYDTKCLERHILLPENADAEFISAEYRMGVLNLYIPKTPGPQKTITNQIVVY